MHHEDLARVRLIQKAADKLDKGEILAVVTGWHFRRRRLMLDLLRDEGSRMEYVNETAVTPKGVKIMILGCERRLLDKLRGLRIHDAITFDLSEGSADACALWYEMEPFIRAEVRAGNSGKLH